MLFPDLTETPVEVFGGYNPSIPPQDLPPGASPNCQDVFFPQGCVQTRGGLSALYPGSPIPNNASINGLKTYLTPTLAQRLMVWDSLGNFFKEFPQGILNLIAARPQGAGLLYQSSTLFGREYQAFFNSSGGADIPRQFDDTNWDRVSQGGAGISPTAADSGTAGNIGAGLHQVSLAFITRQGAILQAAPPSSWVAAGMKQVALTNIATGPSNIVARLLLFTPVIIAPAKTGSFYSLPTGTSQLTTPTAMLINDNVTTSLTVDFNDVVLQAGFQANYLFTQIELGESAFVGGYNSRLAWLGERNKLQNLVNMGFDGGFGAPGVSQVQQSAGPNAPTAASSDAGLAGTAWANPNNCFAPDGVAATAAIPSATGNSQYLKATAYGFNIPVGATITGIVVQALVKGSSSIDLSDNSVKLYKAGAVTGTEHSNGNIWTTGYAYQAYGSSSDLWGAAWTPADINNAGFGVAYSAFNGNATSIRTAYVDYISVTVYYTVSQGYVTVGPWGWTEGATYAGGEPAVANGFTADWGDAFAIVGDGATAVRGLITQSAYQDYLLNPIIARNTSYRVRAHVKRNNTLAQGTLHINLNSVAQAFTTAGLTVTAAQATQNFVEFDALLTAVIANPPSDLLLQVYVDGTPTNNGAFIVDSIEVYPATAPFNYSTATLSHAFNPESYDNSTSRVQIRPNDGQQLRSAFPLRNSYYLAKDHYLCYVTDDGVNEPLSWQVTEVSSTIGICGPNAVDWTEEWAVFAERSGAYICWGSDPVKISQEIDTDATKTGKPAWDVINWAFGHTIWVKIDKVRRMVLIGAPLNGATSPNFVFMLDYKWLMSAQEIADSPVVTYSAFTGKMLAHGRGRRWAPWNITANSMCFAERTDGTSQPFFGNGSANGLIYQQQDSTIQASDNGVAINSFWNSHFAPSSMEEQMLRLTSLRKLLGYITLRASGSGSLNISVTSTKRTTNLRAYVMGNPGLDDAGRPVNMHGERFSISVGTNAVGNWFRLEKLIPFMKKDAAIPVRGLSA